MKDTRVSLCVFLCVCLTPSKLLIMHFYIIYDFQNYMWIVKNICMCTQGVNQNWCMYLIKKKHFAICKALIQSSLHSSRITQHSLGITPICGTNKRERNTHTHTHTQSTIFNNIVFYSCTVQLDTNRIWCLKPAGTIFLCAHIQFQKCFGWQTLLLYKWIAPSNIQAP